MSQTTSPKIFIGIDCGATTSKVVAIDASGQPLSERLFQLPTRGEEGSEAILASWMEGVSRYMQAHGVDWTQVGGVGLAIPGPYLRYGVLGSQPNLPKNLEGWPFLKELTAAVAAAAGRLLPVDTANDGLLAGLAEARLLQADHPGSVLMLSPGSGLGGSYIPANGNLFRGDHDASAIIGHIPLPHEKLGLPRYACGCGRDWGCAEAYTSIAGLAKLLEHFLPDFPGHALTLLDLSVKEKTLALRGLAQEEDPLALAIFDRQAQALGYTIATACMALDATHIVVGGGLMDTEATTKAFRKRYLAQTAEAAAEYSWVPMEQLTLREARLGELSQAVGAALLCQMNLKVQL